MTATATAYIRPYLGEMPAMSVEDFLRWTRRTPGIVVPAAQVAKLIDTATRQPAGEAKLPTTP